MENTKKKWERPQLIILARGMPEETVLTHCKTNNPISTALGPGQAQVNDCAEIVASCKSCQARAQGS